MAIEYRIKSAYHHGFGKAQPHHALRKDKASHEAQGNDEGIIDYRSEGKKLLQYLMRL